MLVRIAKDKNNPYVLINKKFLEDVNLSLKAKGLMAFCMSKPDDWTFNIYQLSKVLKEGRESIYSAFKELIDNGYCVRTQERIHGNFGKSDYVLSEEPNKIAETPCAGNPYTVNPDAGNPDTAHIYTKNDVTKYKETHTPKSPEKKEGVCESDFVSHGSHVKLKPEQLTALNEKLGESMVKDLIEQVNDYCASIGKNYKCYAATIRQWAKRREEEKAKIKGSKVDRTTKDRNGNQVSSPADGLF